MLKDKIKIIEESYQTTIKNPCLIEGISFFSNKKCKAEILPANANSGLVFQYKDVKIEANFQNIDSQEKEHTTTLVKNGIKIKSTEHILASLWGLGIDNALIVLSDPSIPLRDASSEYYTDNLKKAGLQNLKAKRKEIAFSIEHKFTEEGDDRYAIFYPSNNLTIRSTILFNNLINEQVFSFEANAKNFQKEIAWARSFLRSPINDKAAWEEIRKKLNFLPPDPKKSPIIVFDDKNYLTPLKKADEPARHKILDFIGDISLLGIRIRAKIELFKPGHRFNRHIVTELANVLKYIQ
jgi:UDP-3-O-[3-hydroxymyristoyl] N-acetylglucosamine deacetylase